MVRKILIVDDDEDDCDIFCDAVMMVDSEVTCEKALNAKRALQLLRSDYKPDFIFLDLNMPLIDGEACLVEIRKMENLTHVPVIIYTTSKRADHKQKTKNLGANYFLTKPSSLHDLCGEISFIFLTNWTSSSVAV